MKKLLLEGIIVIDFVTLLAAPVAAKFLGDFSATVIKVEQPGVGDPTRGLPHRFAEKGDVEEGTIYCGQIAGLVRDLKSVKEVITEIIEGAEILLNNLQLISKQ